MFDLREFPYIKIMSSHEGNISFSSCTSPSPWGSNSSFSLKDAPIRRLICGGFSFGSKG